MQARGSLDCRVHVDELLVGEQAAADCLALDLANGDLGWADARRGRHGSDEGKPDGVLRVVEAARGRVEGDHGRDLLGVGALEACIAAAMQEGRAPRVGDCVDWAGLDAGGVGAVRVGFTERAIRGAGNVKRVLTCRADGAVLQGHTARVLVECAWYAVCGSD